MKLGAIFAFAAIAIASAQNQPAPQPPGGVYRVGNGVTAPKIISRREPDYTEEARVARMQGSMRLFVVIGADGKPTDIRVLKPMGMGLDENAMDAVGAWRFVPAEKGGQPVAVESNIEVTFHLLNITDWHPRQVTFRVEPGVARPVFQGSPAPPSEQNSGNAAVRMEVQVDDSGRVSEISVTASSDAALNAAAMDVVRNWRFQPAMAGGRPVAVGGTVELVRGSNPPPLR